MLGKSSDWDTWLSFVRNRAEGNDIWELVNPELTERPATLERPKKPEPGQDFNSGPVDTQNYDRYKIQKKEFISELALYDRQKKALTDLVSFIQETIATQYAVNIEAEPSHPWNQLVALKRRLAPSDSSRKAELEQSNIRISKGPINQDLDKWLDEWLMIYTKAKKAGVAEVSETRPIRDFLLAIRSKAQSYADSHLITIDDKKAEDLPNIIEGFRQFIRLIQTKTGKESETHSAFAVSQETQETYMESTSETSFRGKKLVTPRTCLCGETHWFSECPYLNPEVRPANWRPDSATQTKVNEEMRREKTRDRVNKSLERNKAIAERQKKGKNKSKGETSELPATPIAQPNTGTYACIRTTFSAETYSLNGSWILDGGSNSHVCNSTMRSWFTRERSAQRENL